jgi:hypothetical protein
VQKYRNIQRRYCEIILIQRISLKSNLKDDLETWPKKQQKFTRFCSEIFGNDELEDWEANGRIIGKCVLTVPNDGIGYL